MKEEGICMAVAKFLGMEGGGERLKETMISLKEKRGKSSVETETNNLS